jgi:hypothetical protein
VPAIGTLLQGRCLAAQRTVGKVAESLTHSTCLGLTLDGKIIRFVRAISD